MNAAQIALKRRINAAARKRSKADEAKLAATDDLRRLCHAARQAGIPVTAIALEAGISRQAVYDLLGERPSA